MILHWRIRTG